jgi:hypothetical protein
VKRVLKGIRTEWLNLAISIRRNSCELSDSVFILGSPRSGTTWLMEIVTGISGRSPIYEPLRPGSDRFEALIGRLDGFLVLDRSSVQPDLADYLVRVATGRRVSHWSLSQSTLQRHLHSKGYVVKFVRVSRAAAWLSATIPVKQIRIVRGPVATIESYLNSPGPWHTWDVGQFSTLVFGDKTRMLDLHGGRRRRRRCWSRPLTSRLSATRTLFVVMRRRSTLSSPSVELPRHMMWNRFWRGRVRLLMIVAARVRKERFLRADCCQRAKPETSRRSPVTSALMPGSGGRGHS